MKTKIEIKSIFGELLFSCEKEENTLKHTMEEAIKADVSLRYADLRNANLRNADLGDWGSLQSCTDVLFVTPIGSRNGCTIFFHTNKGLFVKCGCFKGTIEEFADKVKETHGGNEHARDYLALVEFVKVKYNVDK